MNGEGWYHTRLKPMLANPVYYVGATVYNKNSHGEFCWRTGGKFIVPPKKKGKATTGRKNAEADWVFPPTTTAIVDQRALGRSSNPPHEHRSRLSSGGCVTNGYGWRGCSCAASAARR